MFLHGMELPSTPSKHARLDNYDPDCGFKDRRSEFDGGEEVGLSLGLGLGQNGKGSKPGGLTFMQMQELQHQSLIYKYIDAGLPVPLHLLVPIWKSVSGSFSRHFPAIIGGNPWMPMEYGRSLDPEPGRCRRTDGKKWRCGKEAVSNHKYCERHMHRGRQQRSRKLVEASASAPAVVVPHLRLQPLARSIEPSADHVHTDMGLHSNTNLSISLSNSNNLMKMNSDVSVSPSSFAFSAKKAESSMCF